MSTVFPNFYKMVKTQFRVGIKKFRSDNAKDYFNQVLSPHFKKEGIIYKSSCISTPQQNMVVERKKWSFSYYYKRFFVLEKCS